MNRKRLRVLLFFLIGIICLQATAFAQDSAPAITSCGDGFLVFENGQGFMIDASGVRSPFDIQDSADVCYCTVLNDTVYWEDMEGSVYCSTDFKETELLYQKMPSVAGIVCLQDADQIVFADGTVYSADSEETMFLPVESVLIGAAVNDYMTILAEQNGTLWIRKPDEDFARVRYSDLYGDNIRLNDMAVMGNTVFICGEKEDGSPFLAGSVMGGVWIERELAVLDSSGKAQSLEGTPLCLAAAEESETLLLGCSDGTVAVLPSCIKCSAFYQIADTAVTDIVMAGESAGFIADGELYIISLNDIPQNDNPEEDCPAGC